MAKEITNSAYDRIMAIALKRAVLYPSSEIYGGVAGFYDWGSVGTRLKKKFEDYWRSYFLHLDANFHEIQPAEIMPEPVFRASGHLESFVDPVVECAKCKLTERADHIIEAELKESFEGKSAEELGEIIKKNKIKCPECKGELKTVGILNMMFPVQLGPFKGITGYLRPETAQGAYLNFKREYTANRERLPLGLAVLGRVFRNEISPRQGVYRMREFNQAELQVFFDPSGTKHPAFKEIANYELNFLEENAKSEKKIKCKDLVVKKKFPENYVYYLAQVCKFYESLGVPSKKMRVNEFSETERAFYNKIHCDVEMWFDSYDCYKEIAATHYRTDYDLQNHIRASKQDLAVHRDGKKIVPHVVELTFGIDRSVFGLLDLNLKTDSKRTYFALPPQIAPYTAGIFPLVRKDKLPEKARKVYDLLRNDFDVFYDETGSIGRMYARIDEIGVLYGITVDHQTLKDDTVTIRERDSMKQQRVKVKELAKHLCEVLPH